MDSGPPWWLDDEEPSISHSLGAGDVRHADLRFGVVSQIRSSQGTARDLVDQTGVKT